MRKVAGWLTIVLGSIYPLVLLLMGILALYVWARTGKVYGDFLSLIWPLVLVISLSALFAGVYIIKSKKMNKGVKQ